MVELPLIKSSMKQRRKTTKTCLKIFAPTHYLAHVEFGITGRGIPRGLVVVVGRGATPHFVDITENSELKHSLSKGR
jgi:hypothetical protein